jgi:signal peptidase II
MENKGAFLGLGSTWPDGTRWVVFTLLSSVLVVGALWVALRGIHKAGSLRAWGPHMGPLLVAAGGIGNLIDRFARDGAVVDFMNMGIGGLRTGIFNVADVYIMVGLGLWLVFSRRDTSEAAAV